MINDSMFHNKYKIYSAMLFIVLFILILLSKISIWYKWFDSFQWKYYVMPSLWLIIILLIVFFIPRIHPTIKLIKQINVYTDAIICAMLFIGMQYIVGIAIYNLGNSPYDLTPRGILLNFLTIIVPFIGKECIRSYILNALCGKRKILILLIIILITTLGDINFVNVKMATNLKSIVELLSKEIGPGICSNLLLSFFAINGGALSSMLYGGLLLIFHWYCPVLPELDWLGQGVLGILIPVVFLVYITSKYERNTYISKLQAEKERNNTITWLVTMLFSVGLIWFVVGVFPVYPTVIATGSMEPMISPGDVVLIKKLSSEEDVKALKLGDIIAFKRDDIIITHRILDIVEESGIPNFITKGDNNSSEDIRVVKPEEVKGIYVQVIPKIGFPTLWLKSDYIKQSIQRDDIEY